jgi:hypothetical protein
MSSRLTVCVGDNCTQPRVDLSHVGGKITVLFILEEQGAQVIGNKETKWT